MKKKNEEYRDAMKMLRKFLKPGKTVYTIIRSVSSSGMTRHIDLYTIYKGDMMFLTGYAAKVMGMRHDYKRGGLVVSGCGMDMCFHTVYSLGRVMYPHGFIPAKAGRHGRNGTPATEVDVDGGYALNNQTL